MSALFEVPNSPMNTGRSCAAAHSATEAKPTSSSRRCAPEPCHLVPSHERESPLVNHSSPWKVNSIGQY